jgi:hypothetical protein
LDSLIEMANSYGIDGNSLVSIEALNWKELDFKIENEKDFQKFLNFCSEKQKLYQSMTKNLIPEVIICEELYIMKGFWKKRNVLIFLFFLFIFFYFFFFYLFKEYKEISKNILYYHKISSLSDDDKADEARSLKMSWE